MAFYDLRAFMSYLQKKDDLVVIKDEVDVDYEIAAYIRKSSDLDGPAFLFEKVRGYAMPVVGGLFGNRRKVLDALEAASNEEALQRMIRGIANPIEPKLVSTGPCKEVKILGDDVDLTRLPIPLYSENDGGKFITVAIQMSKDPDTRSKNAGIYRMMLHSKNELGMSASINQHISVQRMKAEARNERLEIAVAQGLDPAILIASQVRCPYGMDEIAIAGGLRGEPVEVVKCETVDLEVPATSEIVIEGFLRPHERRLEGPFGEFSGYTGPAYMEPVFEVTAITMRKDAIFQAGLTGVPITENHLMKQLPNEATLFSELRRAFPEVTGVCFTEASGTEYLVVIGLKQRYKNQARNLIMGALGSALHPKLVVIVDDDIDIYDPVKVLWAISTRVQPAQDVIIVERAAGAPLDPSIPEQYSTSVMGIDATRPFGKPFADVVTVPGVDKVPTWWAKRGR